MAKRPIYGKMDTSVRFWVDGKSFWSTVPRLAVELALRDYNAEDFTARNYLARVATNSHHNPRGKGIKISARELGIEVMPEKVVVVTKDQELKTPDDEPAQQETLFDTDGFIRNPRFSS